MEGNVAPWGQHISDQYIVPGNIDRVSPLYSIYVFQKHIEYCDILISS